MARAKKPLPGSSSSMGSPSSSRSQASSQRPSNSRDFTTRHESHYQQSHPPHQAVRLSPYSFPPSSSDTIALSSSAVRTALTSNHVNSGNAWATFRQQPGHRDMAEQHQRSHDPETAQMLTPPPPESRNVPVASEKAKAMIQCVRNLQHLDITDAVRELPSICVIGDQSVGKSSLIEALSEISVPRSAGCCTRCPLEINMTNKQSATHVWSCKIYLMKKYFFSGTGRNKGNPLGPWVQQQAEEILFASTDNKDTLRAYLERAQVAILNPSTDHIEYLPTRATYASDIQVKFSPNVIRLDIESDQVADLSLFDLPGVISVSENDNEQYLVPLVEALVTEYIKSGSSINLLALPMNNDTTNSGALKLVRRQKAIRRTLGVLTKPDLLQANESFEQWTDILAGRKFDLGLGYFVVRNSADPNVTHAVARKQERAFFDREPWSTALAEKGSRFGTDNLARELQRLLEQHIRHNLPTIRNLISERIVTVEELLRKLPARLETPPVVVVTQSLGEFKYGLRAIFGMAMTNNRLRKQFNRLAADFRKILKDTKPSMQIKSRAEYARYNKLKMALETPTKSADRGSSSTPSLGAGPSKGQEVVDLDSEPEVILPNGLKRKHEEPYDSCKKSGITLWLDDIRDINQENYAFNIPKLLNPKAIDILNQRSVHHWNQPVSIFMAKVRTLVSATIKEQAAQAFEPTRLGSKFYKHVLRNINEFLTGALQVQADTIDEVLRMEVQVPYTLDSTTMERVKGETLDKFRKLRQESRIQDLNQLNQSTPTKGKGKRDDALPPEEFGDELEMLATVRGYYEIASTRFVDNVCQGIQGVLFTRCCDGLYERLEEYFKVKSTDGEAFCAELLADDPEIVRQRDAHEAEIGRLNAALEEVEKIYGEEDTEVDIGVELTNGNGEINGNHAAFGTSQSKSAGLSIHDVIG